MTLQSRLQTCKDEIAQICHEVGRDPASVRLIAVSKTVGLPQVSEAISLGQTDFGENRTKLFKEKYEAFPQANWHFIGRLQSNKAHEVVGKSYLIHSLDRMSLLYAIEKSASKLNIVQDVLLEVNISGEESKAGLIPEDVPPFIEELYKCKHVRCLGMMTMAPLGDITIARKTFAGLRKLAQEMKARYEERGTISFDELSMGMSNDYTVAIREGATMVRIGRKIFSESFEL